MAAAALVARMGRTVALSSDIATRVVYKRWFLEQTYDTIAAELEIGTTTAWQIYQRFVQTDGVETFQGRRPNDPWNGLVSSHLREPLLRALTECDAESDLQDIADAFQRLTGVAVSTSAICRTSIAMGWTRKILSQLLDRHDEQAAHEFVLRILSTYAMCQLVWADEASCDARNLLTKRFGRALRGERANSERGITVRGQRWSVLGVFDVTRGYVDHFAVEGPIDAELLFEAVTNHVMPHMNPFTGPQGREERSVLVWDNCRTHGRHELLNLMSELGFVVEFLPPYCPEIAPHEKCLRRMKLAVRAAECDFRAMDLGVPDLIEYGMAHVTPAVFRSALHECGYGSVL